jgi:hypothetical protein
LSDTDPFAAKTPEEVAAQEAARNPVVAPEPVADRLEDEVKEAEALESPNGTISEILEWVGGSPERAQIALAAEEAGQNRKNLVRQLRNIAL